MLGRTTYIFFRRKGRTPIALEHVPATDMNSLFRGEILLSRSPGARGFGF
jgi:hypothetical protein